MSAPRTVADRRRELLNWLREKPEHRGLRTSEVVAVSGIYDDAEHNDWLGDRIARAGRDLNALAQERLVLRLGHPARWHLPVERDAT